ncbi:TMV resistance protein N [Morella rubra]|uniref:TMV resistance protein N n=1 Tax=Morella rubra TaxID=262757 RepID=A0A6A1WVN1_9ROSI|nr:TMV resistance protein N [Morella rubra]
MDSVKTEGASSSSLEKGGKGRRVACPSSSKEGKKRKKTLSSSFSSISGWQQEVFLSFHGEDTRKGFTDHLYAALQRKGILTFRDDENLQRGKCIGPGLLKAIKESIYAIVIISQNYASSKWCLIELVQIVKCMREKETILPIFYHVHPSAVRKQTDSFAQAFEKHEKDPEVDMEQIQTWRDALTQVANISGWHVQDR